MIGKVELPIYRLASTKNLPGFGPGDEGSGAGAGGTAGTAVTLELVNDAINKTVNNAIANLKKTDLPKIVETSIATAMAPMGTQLGTISEALAALSATNENGSGSGSGNGQGGSGGNGGGTGQGGQGLSPEMNAQIKQMNDTLRKQGETISHLQKERDDSNKRAETAEKTSVIKGALGDLQFANSAAMNTAFTLIDPLVKKNGDSYVGNVDGDELPITDFIKDFIPKLHGYLLKPTGTGGSGASSSGGSNGNTTGRNVDISTIKTGMKPEERAAVLAAISAALPNQS